MEAHAATAATTAAPATPARPETVARWLLIMAFLVFLMVVVGGITRLTESGLSIVRWEPVTGTLPPVSEAAWQAEFDAYRATPQYQQINRGMSLDEFKNIYFWEYVHRLLGRVIGLAFFLPLVWFWVKGAIPRGYKWKLVALFLLGGLQGAIGWWMVASGLVDRPEVSHIRLAVHLLNAFLIFGLLVWVALDLKRLARDPHAAPAGIPILGLWVLAITFIQFLFGAYVAGLEAGYAFNSWPLMGEEWFPSGTPMLEPFLRNLVDNPIVVQFVHRWLAFAVVGLCIWLAAIVWSRGHAVEGALLILAVLAQLVLGILTILSGVELWIGVAHQGMAVLLLGAIVLACHRLGTRSAFNR